jgi:ribonucleotide reductase beta subunit family protein with ferritin-like domain
MMNDDRSWDELSDAEKRFRMLIFDVTETMREFSRALSRTTRARGA